MSIRERAINFNPLIVYAAHGDSKGKFRAGPISVSVQQNSLNLERADIDGAAHDAGQAAPIKLKALSCKVRLVPCLPPVSQNLTRSFHDFTSHRHPTPGETIETRRLS